MLPKNTEKTIIILKFMQFPMYLYKTSYDNLRVIADNTPAKRGLINIFLQSHLMFEYLIMAINAHIHITASEITVEIAAPLILISGIDIKIMFPNSFIIPPAMAIIIGKLALPIVCKTLKTGIQAP